MSTDSKKYDQALSRLLDQAPDIAPSPDLRSQILTAARQQSHPSAQVIDFPHPAAVAIPQPRAADSNWMAGGFMAASLALGIWIGAAGLADTLVSAPLELAGLQPSETSAALSVDDMLEGFSTTGDSL